eukprot:g5044.t1
MSSIVSRVRNCYADTPNTNMDVISNFKVTTQAGDHQFIKANTKYCAVALIGGGGPVMLWDHSKMGRVSSKNLKVAGHGGTVTDFDFHPFNEQLFVTGSSDCIVRLWNIPPDTDQGMVKDTLTELEGHSKRITYTTFHPAAANVLAVADFNKEMMVWDLQKSEEPMLKFAYDKAITDVKWNFDGTQVGTYTKDHRIRIHDPRTGDTGGMVFEKCHHGLKAAKICFIERRNRVFSFGVGRTHAREIRVWDMRKPGSKSLHHTTVDRGSGCLIPFYERSTNLLFVAGKGDSSIKIMEAFEDDPFVTTHSSTMFKESAVGYCLLPKRSCDTKKHEVAHMLRLTTTKIQPCSFRVPRRATNFQKDLYMDDYSGVAAMSASEYFKGGNKPPVLMSLNPKDRSDGKDSGAGASFEKAKSRDELEKELEGAQYKLRVLNAEVALYKSQLKDA